MEKNGNFIAVIATMSSAAPTFNFSHLPDASFPVLTKKENEELLAKWDMSSFMHMTKYAFDAQFKQVEYASFVKDFLSSPVVQSTLRTINDGKVWATPLAGTTVQSVECTLLKTNVVNMSFFDRLTSEGVVRDTGHIVKCFDKYIANGIVVSDRLRELLLDEEDCDFMGTFKQDEQLEVVYRIMRALVCGGGLCQYEDMLEPYLAMTKEIYKDLVAVHKNPHTGKPEVLSVCVDVQRVQTSTGDVTLFAVPDCQANLFILAIDPLRRTVTVLYFSYVPAF